MEEYGNNGIYGVDRKQMWAVKSFESILSCFRFQGLIRKDAVL